MPVIGTCEKCGYDPVINYNYIVCMKNEIEKLEEGIKALEQTVDSQMNIIRAFLRDPERTKKVWLDMCSVKEVKGEVDLSVFEDLNNVKRIKEENGKLRDALRPFIDVANETDDLPWGFHLYLGLTTTHCRQAREAAKVLFDARKTEDQELPKT